jgi:hypothetical protein
MDTKLDFLVIGAQKCATSWMYYCLKEHSEILLPNDKLEYAYFGSELFLEKGEQWYSDRFDAKQASQLRGEVAVDYLYDKQAAHFLYQQNQRPKFIASLRHPLDRFVSSYYWLIRKNKLPNVPINEGIDIVLSQKKGFPDKIDSPLEEVVRRGCYGNQVESYLKHFDPKNFLILLYEEIDAMPLESIKKVYKFLDVDSTYMPKSLNEQPKKNSYNSKLIKMERLVDRKYLLGKILAKIANKANQMMSKKEAPFQNQLNPENRKRLMELYTPQIEYTINVVNQIPTNQRPNLQEFQSLWKIK